MALSNETRALFNAYLDRQAELNGADRDAVRTGKAFTIEPSVQQKLIDKQQESSSFLKSINVVPVNEMSGEVLGLNISGPLASRTDTSGAGRRVTKDPSGMTETDYLCKQTNSDTHIRYAKLDMWAKFPDFQSRISNQIAQRQALDRIMIGFNGVSAAATTNLVNFPLLQDVNVGWLQRLRALSPERVLAEAPDGVENGKIIIGEGGDYANLDSLVMDAVHSLLPEWARNDPNLVAIVGSDLLHDKYFPMVDQPQAPTEQLALDVIMSKKQLGGRRAATVPYFPGDAIFVTTFSNLSIYEQEGKRRRTVREAPDADRIETFESSNDAYVIEDHDFACLIENIQLGVTA